MSEARVAREATDGEAMTADREQTRRDAELRKFLDGNGYEVVSLGDGSRSAVPIAPAAAIAELDALLAELEQSERKVPALVEALKELAGYVRALLAGQVSRPELIWALEQSDEALAVWEQDA